MAPTAEALEIFNDVILFLKPILHVFATDQNVKETKDDRITSITRFEWQRIIPTLLPE